MAEDAPSRVSVWHSAPGRALPNAAVTRLAEAVLKAEGVEYLYIGVVLSRRDEVHRMNREFLEHDYPTDVLSFRISDEGDALEGEVYVDLDMAAERAPEFGTRFSHEAARYVVHGLLHLAGHDDARPEQREHMRELENRYLERFWPV